MRILFFMICLVSVQTVWPQSPIRFSEAKAPYMTVGPTIARLEQLSGTSLRQEIENLWNNAEMTGTPLIEKDPLYDDYVYVTFIYRNENPNIDVKLFIPGIYDEYRFGDSKMYRLKNTALYYRCYLLPDDVCMSYRFDVKSGKNGKAVRNLDAYNKNRIPKGEKRDYSYSVLDLNSNGTDRSERKYFDTGSRIDTFKLTSRMLNNTRDVYVYLPPGYDPSEDKKYPVIWLFDAFVYMNRVEVPVVLDNLITEKETEPVIAVMFDNPTSESRYAEYPLNFDFKEAFISEIVPLVKSKYKVSSDPGKNIIGGMSYGGLNALFTAFYHPDVFGKVLSQSASLWRDLKLTDSNGNEIRNDWLIRQYASSNKLNLKIFLDWGLQENMVLGSNRTFVKVLSEKQYDFEFMEFDGWHNWANTRRTFPTGLRYLLN